MHHYSTKFPHSPNNYSFFIVISLLFQRVRWCSKCGASPANSFWALGCITIAQSSRTFHISTACSLFFHCFFIVFSLLFQRQCGVSPANFSFWILKRITIAQSLRMSHISTALSLLYQCLFTVFGDVLSVECHQLVILSENSDSSF